MTNSTGKQKKHRKKFQHLSKNGARNCRKFFIETEYIRGVVNDFGEQVIRPMNKEELEFLDKYYKEEVHGTFKTDKESTQLFRKAKRVASKIENIEFFEKNGFHPEEVQQAVEEFNAKSKSLGNLVYDFWSQREVNADSYKRRLDIQNNAILDVQLESFEDIQYMSDNEVDCEEETTIEDLITESEK
jgi:hypothetical protein